MLAVTTGNSCSFLSDVIFRVLLCAVVITSWSAVKSEPLYDKEAKLLDTLFDGYHKDIVPQPNASYPITIWFDTSLVSLLDVNEKEGTLTATMYTQYEWVDERLKWTVNDTFTIDRLVTTTDKIWIPDMQVYNSIRHEDVLVPHVTIYNNGSVHYVPHKLLQVPCEFDLTAFPFDSHQCSIQIGPWASPASQIVMEVPDGEQDGLLTSYMTNSDWDMREFTIKSYHLHYGGADNYTTVEVSMMIKRRGSYYNRLFVAPAAVALFVIPVIHFMPPTSNEKLTLAGLILVSTCILFEMIEDLFPAFSLSNTPLLLNYYTGLLVILFISMLLSCLSVMVGSGDTKSKRVPLVLRKYIINTLGYICCARGRTARYDYELLHLERSLQYSASNQHDQDEQELDDVNNGSDSEGPSSSQNHDQKHSDIAEVLKTLVNEMQYRRYKDQVKTEWAQLATVLDRTGGLLLLILAVIMTVAITAHAK